MTLFAGIFSLSQKRSVDNSTAEIIEKQLGRAEGKLDVFRSPYFFLVKFDFGAFGEPGYFESDQEVSAVAGEPFLVLGEEEVESRIAAIRKLSGELAKGNISILNFCSGTFSICHYNRATHRVVVATDKLGVRPVYYFFNNEMAYFSSSIRVLELIRDIPKVLNISVFIEKSVFGTFLGDHTPYCDIRVLRDGQYFRCDGRKPEILSYFRWDQLPIQHKDEGSLMQECHEFFVKAVKCRSQRANAFFSTLSGGLDSRCIVSVLNHLGKEVIALNFSPTGSQDEVFSKQYAGRIGIDFVATSQPLNDWAVASQVTEKLNKEFTKKIKYPKLMFSGDGGSVGVGHVYMKRELIDLLKQDKIEDAIRSFLKNKFFPTKLIKKDLVTQLLPIPFNRLKEEMDDLRCTDKGRSFHLFLMRNNQKRHLHEYYEKIDLVGIELLLPFYDARFLKVILSTPVEPFLYHEFYHKWLNLFPKDTGAVPWQTYPGHACCPIKPEVNQSDQWELAKKRDFIGSKSSMKKCFNVMKEPDFPKEIIDRRILLMAILFHKIKLEDYSYIFSFTLNLYNFYSKCESIRVK